ncbi:MAG: hypothetical protein V1872_12060 [bacterium]
MENKGVVMERFGKKNNQKDKKRERTRDKKQLTFSDETEISNKDTNKDENLVFSLILKHEGPRTRRQTQVFSDGKKNRKKKTQRDTFLKKRGHSGKDY